ncbi:MAG TPA: hypothetical protein VGC26_07895 [Afipia sp.]
MTALAIAVPMSAAPAQAKPALIGASGVKTPATSKAHTTNAVAGGITDISSRRYYRRYGYGYGYRPRYYRPYGYARPYGYGYARPYGYGYGGYYRRPGIYLGF